MGIIFLEDWIILDTDSERAIHLYIINYYFYLFILVSEPASDVKLWYVGDNVDHGHDSHQPQHQVDCHTGLVH